MMELMQSFGTQLQGMPVWVQIWVLWLALLNSSSIFFVFTRAETRWALLAWIVAGAGVMGIFAFSGQEMTRLMGLGHIIGWTPLMIYLWSRRGEIYLTHLSGIFLHLLFLSNGLSLVFDYLDLVRFFLGHSY